MTASQEGGPRGRPEGQATPTKPPPHRTRVSGMWLAVIVALIVLIVLLVFILQNLGSVTVTFFGVTGHMPLGVAMLLSALAGAVLVALVGVARILQLRRATRRAHRAGR